MYAVNMIFALFDHNLYNKVYMNLKLVQAVCMNFVLWLKKNYHAYLRSQVFWLC